MADVTLSPRPNPAAEPLAVADGDLLRPLAGNWTAHLVFADQVDPPTGRVTLRWLGKDLAGYVRESGAQSGRVYALVEGGDGGLAAPRPAKLSAQHFQRLPARVVLSQLCSEGGERMSLASDSVVMATTLDSWPRRADDLGALLDDLCRALAASWQVLPDGSVWVGRHAFAEAELAEELQELDDADPAYKTAPFVPHSFGPEPGQSYLGRPVGCALYTICPEGPHLRLWFLSERSSDLDAGNLRAALARIIRETLRPDFYARYPGRVVMQRLDGTLDVLLDTSAIPKLPGVRYRCGIPGAQLTILPGTRVLVGFEQADPQKPIVELFEGTSPPNRVALVSDSTQADSLQVAADASGGPLVITLTGTTRDGVALGPLILTIPGGAVSPSIGTPLQNPLVIAGLGRITGPGSARVRLE